MTLSAVHTAHKQPATTSIRKRRNILRYSSIQSSSGIVGPLGVSGPFRIEHELSRLHYPTRPAHPKMARHFDWRSGPVRGTAYTENRIPEYRVRVELHIDLAIACRRVSQPSRVRPVNICRTVVTELENLAMPISGSVSRKPILLSPHVSYRGYVQIGQLHFERHRQDKHFRITDTPELRLDLRQRRAAQIPTMNRTTRSQHVLRQSLVIAQLPDVWPNNVLLV